MEETRQKMRGVLLLFYETGYEGDGWAFQDERFISKNTTSFYCRKCGLCWDKKLAPDGPPTPEGRYCPPDSHDFQLTSDESWSYDGLHFLRDGDELTIYDKKDPSKIVWSGKISRRRHLTGRRRNKPGQAGVRSRRWYRWLDTGFPATLLPKSDS